MALKRLDGWGGYDSHEEYYSVDSVEELETLRLKRKGLERNDNHGSYYKVSDIGDIKCGGHSMCFDGIAERGRTFRGIGFSVHDKSPISDWITYYIIFERK